jgi:(R,R)-butanediol dehydrogenase/meso-butanediol dehydrogenase/diacetyl reductase
MGVIDIDEPPPPAQSEVQIDVSYCGVCGSDLHQVEHNLVDPNTVMGHEFSAVVRSSGSDADRFGAGTRVTVRPFLSCGNCDRCTSDRGIYCSNALAIGTGQGLAASWISGGMAPRINVPLDTLHPISDDLGLEQAALVEPLAVALHAVRTSGLEKGQSVVVMGAGPIGVALVACARQAGAGTIIVTEQSSARAEQAAAFGADHALVAGSDDVAARVQALTRGGADVVFDAVGVPGMIEEAVRHVTPGGRVQIVGVCMEVDPVFPAGWLMKEPRIQICFVYTEAEFAEMVDLVASRKIVVDEMISRIEPMANIQTVFDSLRTAKTDVKVLLQPGMASR